MIQQENPNRRVKNPPPFVYHPELYPELAKNNPEPFEFEEKPKVSKRKRNPSVLGLSKAEDKDSKSTLKF